MKVVVIEYPYSFTKFQRAENQRLTKILVLITV